MSSQSGTESGGDKKSMIVGAVMRAAMIAFFMVLQAVILFGAAGRMDWSWAWVFIGISLAVPLINSIFMLRGHLETAAERGRLAFAKDWDKVISGVLALTLYILVPLVAGLDERFHWTGPFSPAWNIVGGVGLAAGYGLASWAMLANAYFSTAVRIQSERGHAVCDSGPYRFVRHPGYVGFILQSLSTPVLLGSLWALLPGIATMVLYVIRTSLEDRTLQAELPGYPEYVQRVRYRLIPGIW